MVSKLWNLRKLELEEGFDVIDFATPFAPHKIPNSPIDIHINATGVVFGMGSISFLPHLIRLKPCVEVVFLLYTP